MMPKISAEAIEQIEETGTGDADALGVVELGLTVRHESGNGKGHGDTMIVQGALDNLLRGASGTAVQNMNIMFGFDETEGLNFNTPFYP